MSEQDEQTSDQAAERVHVCVIDTKGQSALVQTDDFKQWFVPVSAVSGNSIDRETLDRAILHGVPWESYIDTDAITGDGLARMLRKAGIHTQADLQQCDRRLIRIGTKLIGQAVQDAAQRARSAQPLRR